jgi:enoyl-CoA hydratase
MYEHIAWERTDNVVLITLNRPRVLNALNRALKRELADALTRIKGDESVRAVVVTGAGEQAFSAGQDLTEAKDMSGRQAEEWVREFEQLYDQVRMLDVPVIAAVNGWARARAASWRCWPTSASRPRTRATGCRRSATGSRRSSASSFSGTRSG